MNTTTNEIVRNTLTLTADETRDWGALAADGCEADDCGEYRRSVIREIEDHVRTTRKPVEVYAANEHGGWMITIVGEGLAHAQLYRK